MKLLPSRLSTIAAFTYKLCNILEHCGYSLKLISHFICNKLFSTAVQFLHSEFSVTAEAVLSGNWLIERASVVRRFNRVMQLPERRISCLGHGTKWVFVDTVYSSWHRFELCILRPRSLSDDFEVSRSRVIVRSAEQAGEHVFSLQLKHVQCNIEHDPQRGNYFWYALLDIIYAQSSNNFIIDPLFHA